MATSGEASVRPPWCRRMGGSPRLGPPRARKHAIGAEWSWRRLDVSASAHQFEAFHRRVRTGFVGLLDDKTHMDDHPVAGGESLLGQHPDVHLPPLTRDIDEGELAAI